MTEKRFQFLNLNEIKKRNKKKKKKIKIYWRSTGISCETIVRVPWKQTGMSSLTGLLWTCERRLERPT